MTAPRTRNIRVHHVIGVVLGVVLTVAAGCSVDGGAAAATASVDDASSGTISDAALGTDAAGSGVTSADAPSGDVIAPDVIAPDMIGVDTLAADTVATDALTTDALAPDASPTDAASGDGGDVATGDATSDTVDAGILDGGVEDGAMSDSADGGPEDAEASGADSGPQVCFHGAPPGPNANVADVPQADFTKCKLPTPSFFGTTCVVPSPTLKVELGTHNPVTGAFVPYVDNQWLPMVHGPQGGFHVYVATRVTIPWGAGFDPVVKLQAEIQGYAGCKLAAAGKQPVLYAHAEKLKTGVYTTASTTSAGTLVVFPVSSGLSHLYCGIWLELVLRVRVFGTNKWGQATLTVRTYDMKKK